MEELRCQEQFRKGKAKVVVNAELEALKAFHQAQQAIHAAEGEAESLRRLANAELYAAEKKAEAAKLQWGAKAEGLSKVIHAVWKYAILSLE